MSLAEETYILLAEKREGRSGSNGDVFPIFNDAARPDFLKPVSRFDDITLRTGGTIGVSHEGEGSCCFILPLAGAVDLLNGDDVIPVENGSWVETRNRAGRSFRVGNPFDRPVNFLLISYTEDAKTAGGPEVTGARLALDNRLIAPDTPSRFPVVVGRFAERESVEVSLRSPGVLAYVIEGIFEVKDRLLQSRDALSVPDTMSLDFECFTAGGIILFICDSVPPVRSFPSPDCERAKAGL